jgi:exodeoxyribonuclease VII large subunit
MPEIQKTFSVSEYLEHLNIFFKEYERRIQGEVSEVKFPASGHVYFTIKDKSGEAVIDCIMWRGAYALCGVDIERGMEVIITGHPNVYPKTGRLSVIASSVELVGEGALKKAYDKLKAQLEEEGIFAPERKRQLPEFIHTIGVITSREGAVIDDFRHNIGKYGFEVRLANSKVEGQPALPDLIAAVQAMRSEKIDVLVVIRGGGSLESLQAFNNENLVRAIADFPVPVIAGIGHDRDVPLVALVADYMVSTPTAAAHLVNASWDAAFQKIQKFTHLIDAVRAKMEHDAERMNYQIDTIMVAFETMLRQARYEVDLAEKTIAGNNPERQLRLGYSITRSRDKIIKMADKLKAGDVIETQFARGRVASKIQNNADT